MDNTGIAYINDKDIYTTFGASLIGGSFENMLLRPDRKETAENDMISHPGVQAFTDNIQPQARDIELSFLIEGDSLEDYLQKYDALLDELDSDTTGSIFALRITPLRTTYKLQRKPCLSFDTVSAGKAGKLIVTVRELNPKDRITL